jgi:rRNA biogenesis protein RRP5
METSSESGMHQQLSSRSRSDKLCRGICERAVALKLSKKKAKYVITKHQLLEAQFLCRFLFKKWLELEKRIGDETGEGLVKQKAVEWTLNAANSETATVN